MWLRDMKWANAVGEAALIDVQTLGGHKPSNLPKKCNARASCEAQESKVCLYSNFRFKGKRILKRFPIKTLIKKVECLINIKGNLRTRKIIRLYFIMIKGSSIHREHTSLLAMCATKNHLKICKANLTELNRKLDKFTVTVRDFYTPLSGW